MNRSVPQVWKNNFYDLSASVLGADLLITVDSYDKTERSVKYALLCIILTFASFFLVETIYKRPMHFIQYGLAGLALVLFYTLLLSISEYLQFPVAYLVASSATVLLLSWYTQSIFKKAKTVIIFALLLSALYLFIYVLIQMEDNALLFGSIGLFVLLAVAMYLSRKIDWYGIGRKTDASGLN